jgi:hypothetical protein
MRLAEFIRTNLEQILREWEEFAGRLAGDVSLPRWLLRDHAKPIVASIADGGVAPVRGVRELGR